MPGREAGLAEQRRLLVAGHAGDRDRRAEQARRRSSPKIAAVVADLGQQRARDAEQLAAARRPSAASRMSNSSVRLALVASVAWTAPPVRRHSRKLSIVPNASSPRSARSRAPGHVVEHPGELGRRRNRGRAAGRFARGPAASAPVVPSAARTASAVRRSCQTMARWIGSPVARSQTHHRLALVGDADRGDAAGLDRLRDRLRATVERVAARSAPGHARPSRAPG